MKTLDWFVLKSMNIAGLSIKGWFFSGGVRDRDEEYIITEMMRYHMKRPGYPNPARLDQVPYFDSSCTFFLMSNGEIYCRGPGEVTPEEQELLSSLYERT